MNNFPPGWYQDPFGIVPGRWWDGAQWTTKGDDYGHAVYAPLPTGDEASALSADEIGELSFPHAFVLEAEERERVRVRAERPQLGPILARVKEAVRGELTVNGILYLGVLLVMVGLVGFAAFSFSSVSTNFRPVAEVAAPLVLVLLSWILTAKKAPQAGGALLMLAALILPFSLIASLTDGAAVLPDLAGQALLYTIAGACAVLGGVYTLAASRAPALGRVGVPVGLLGLLALGGLFAPLPSGQEIATIHSAQAAFFLAGVSVLAVVLHLTKQRLVALPWAMGAGLVLLLTSSVGSGVSHWGVALASAASILGMEVLLAEKRLPTAPGQVLQSVLLLVSSYTIPVAHAWVGVGAGILGIGLLELQQRRMRSEGTLVLGMIAVLAAALPSQEHALPALVLWGSVTVWSVVRRVVTSSEGRDGVALVGILSSLLFLVALGSLTSASTAVLVGAGVALGLAGLARLTSDRVWGDWSALLATVALAVSLVVGQLSGSALELGVAGVVGAAALLLPRGDEVLRRILAALSGAWALHLLGVRLDAASLSVALLVLSIVFAVAAWRVVEKRQVLSGLSVMSLSGGVQLGFTALHMPFRATVVISALVGGGLFLLLAGLTRKVAAEKVGGLVLFPLTLLIGGALRFLDQGSRGGVDTLAGDALLLSGLCLVVGVLLARVGFAKERSHVLGLLPLLLGGALALHHTGSSPFVLVESGVAVLVAAVVAWVGTYSPRATWEDGASTLLGSALVVSVIGALSVPARFDVVLVAVAAALAAWSVRERLLLAGSPVAAWAAWCVFASARLSGAEWYTVPAALAILTVVSVVRDQRRAAGAGIPRELTLLEWAGMVLFVTAPLVHTFTLAASWGLLAAALGGGIALWGVVTKVRRRLLFGTGVAVGSVLSMLVLSLTHVLPPQGAALWLYTVAGGLLLLMVAAGAERGRSAFSGRLSTLTEGWE